MTCNNDQKPDLNSNLIFMHLHFNSLSDYAQSLKLISFVVILFQITDNFKSAIICLVCGGILAGIAKHTLFKISLIKLLTHRDRLEMDMTGHIPIA